MPDLQYAHQYEDRATQAVYSVLLEIGQVLGSYRDKFVVIGGSVPWLLHPNANPAHIGTTDIGLCLDAEALGDGQYATMIELLEASGFIRGTDDLRPFQMARHVSVDSGPLVTVTLDFLMPREAKIEKNRPPIIEGFAVQRADGASLAMRFNVPTELDGTMPDGRHNTLTINVASTPALLVMKGYALVGRQKNKDAYDIYYAIKVFEGGHESLATALKPLMSDPIASTGLKHIADKFKAENHYGPETVRKFLEGDANNTGMSPVQIQVDAYRQVRALLDAIGDLD
jgi:hypothetical protein